MVLNIEDYERKGILYAEKYGVVSYEIKNNTMVYHEKFPTEGIYEVLVNLDDMKEIRRKAI